MPLYVNCITGDVACQGEIALDDGRRKWSARKVLALKIADMMSAYDVDRASKIRGCGTYLEFAVAPDGKRLHHANFCRERMCPMCQWRRSIKLRVQADRIYAAECSRGYQHIFVTLTARNCGAAELSGVIDVMCVAFRRWSRSADFRRSFLGYYRAIEVTYNADSDTYHPHIHCILTVCSDYFVSDNPDYWTHDRIMVVWRDLMDLDYAPTVHVEGVRPRDGQTITAACVELCKYPTKTVQLPNSGVLSTVDYALRGRRLIQWGGITAQVRRDMQMDDIDSGNLVHTDEATADGVDLPTVVYIWRYGFYCPADFSIVSNS